MSGHTEKTKRRPGRANTTSLTGQQCCPAEKIGREIADLWAVRSSADKRSIAAMSTDPALSEKLDRLEAKMFERNARLIGALAACRATSAAGAMAQLMHGYDSALQIAVANMEDDGALREEWSTAIACLYSVLMYLEETAGVSADTLGAGHLMPERDNPHLVVHRARAA